MLFFCSFYCILASILLIHGIILWLVVFDQRKAYKLINLNVHRGTHSNFTLAILKNSYMIMKLYIGTISKNSHILSCNGANRIFLVKAMRCCKKAVFAVLTYIVF